MKTYPVMSKFDDITICKGIQSEYLKNSLSFGGSSISVIHDYYLLKSIKELFWAGGYINISNISEHDIRIIRKLKSLWGFDNL